ncbi:MAG: hypothetical protein HC822_22580 [Oscillochloris sp.]|nr:hypothetical protein [Oscillochloris sp.]
MTWNDASLKGLIEIGGIPQELRDLPMLRHLWRAGGPAWLAFLRHIPDPDDIAALARYAADPNTRPEALVILAGIFPAEFCANPVLPLLLLEDPNLPATFDSVACRGTNQHQFAELITEMRIRNHGLPSGAGSASPLHPRISRMCSAPSARENYGPKDVLDKVT